MNLEGCLWKRERAVADNEGPSNNEWMVVAGQSHGSIESVDTTIGSSELSFSRVLS